MAGETKEDLFELGRSGHPIDMMMMEESLIVDIRSNLIKDRVVGVGFSERILGKMGLNS